MGVVGVVGTGVAIGGGVMAGVIAAACAAMFSKGIGIAVAAAGVVVAAIAGATVTVIGAACEIMVAAVFAENA